MRAALFTASLVLAVAPVRGFAQSTPYVATVSDPEVKLRAGPSDKYPETGSLPRGCRVTVDHEEPAGWLAIQAPHTSVSWVPTQFLGGFDPTKPLPQNAVVHGEGEVTLAAGQVGVPQPLEIRRVKVPDGTILVVVGGKTTFQNKTWFPVVPPDGDFRYVPRTSVKAMGTLDNTFVVTGSSTAKPNPPAAIGVPAALPTAATMAEAPRAGGINHPLWAQAEAAELAGRLDDAEKLFFELARVMNEPGGDHDVANQCYTRIHSLREKKRLNLASGSAAAPAASGTWVPTRPDEKVTSAGRTDNRVGSRTAGTSGRGALLPPAADPRDADSAKSGKWSGTGFLIRTGYALDGKRTFALETNPRVVKYYVVEGPGVDLSKYVNRKVDLYGTVSSRRDLPQPCMVVTTVEMGE